MAILTKANFVAPPYLIPNQTESTAWLDSWIADREAELLKKLLGLDLYNPFKEALEDSAPLDQKWVDLRDGKEYVYGDVSYEYVGVIKMLRPAIYSLWLEINYKKPTNAGIIASKGQENTEVLNPTEEITKAWNQYVRYVNYCYMEDSFYGFMTVNKADYEVDGIEWIFRPPYTKNRFGL